ncbi:ATP-dependent DNA helicase [Litorihabitans aurantiacus]|uniref:DNA 5'-3' helicase n=1 Tax=Litorihabitans aurantiacus TaxID=1930061 RepID=A0AA37XFJ7_9MICO|nr:hypothetical protein GCM10025875_17370 [Litorihabitans aurantiacus]
MADSGVALDLDDALDLVVAARGGQRRKGQHAMANAVEEALAGRTPLLVEAGTGTGKSYAYLVPAVLRAVTHGERVIVSTATLALQRQILSTDLPAVADALAPRLPREPDVALLKGWHNYACRHKVSGGYPEEAGALFDLEPPAEHPATDADEGLGAQVLRVREWVADTESGDRDELVPGVSDRAWRQVSVTKMDCLGTRCPLLSECFPERARTAAKEADVVVTNHAMLGIAATGSPGVLPEHHALVVDEAHELTSRSRSAATAELSGPSIDRIARMVRRNAGVVVESLEQCASQLAAAIIAVPPGRLPHGPTEQLTQVVTMLAAACREALTATKPSGGSGGPASSRATAVSRWCARR